MAKILKYLERMFMPWRLRIILLEQQLKASQKATEVYRERAVEIEDAIEKEFGIKIRQEITEVITEFSKLEMVLIYAGIVKLIKGDIQPDETRLCIDLLDKIQLYIDDMKEEDGVKKIKP